MSTDVARYAGDATDQPFEYRALSTGAIASLVLGLLSFVVVLAAATSIEACMMVAPIAIAGILVGVRSIVAIRRMPEEWSGLRLATAGVALSATFLVGGLATAGFIRFTEVPEGYTRISFGTLRPDERDQRLGVFVPADVLSYDGQKVFIKGYMRPSSQQYQLDEFLLVRDNNECCFGDIDKVKYHDRILVRMADPLRVDYRTQVLRVGGTLSIDADKAPLGPGYAVFTLEADYVQ